MDWSQITPLIETYGFAAIILIVGYFIAKFIGGMVAKLLAKTPLDDKLARLMGKSGGSGMEKAFGKFVFWIIMLIVLVAALDKLGLGDDVTEPLRKITTDVFGAIPNILKAGILLALSVFVAVAVKSILGGVLGASQIDERLGFTDGGKPVTNSILTAIFWFLILLFLPGVLNALNMKEVSAPIEGLVSDITGYLPNILVGIIIFAIGFFIARIVQKILFNVLQVSQFDTLPAKLGFNGNVGEGAKSPSGMVSYGVMALITVITGAQAIDKMQLGFLSELSQGFVGSFLQILAGVIIFGVALFAANIVHGALKDKNAFLASAAKIAILVFGGAMALQRSNIAPQISTGTFQTLIMALGVALGVGGAIALGLGGRSTVEDYLQKKVKK